MIVVPLKIGCEPVGAASVKVFWNPDTTGPLIVTDVASLVKVICVPAFNAFKVVPFNNCVELAGVDAVNKFCFKSKM